jgi:dTDP-glucose 4,6-dehydratase
MQSAAPAKILKTGGTGFFGKSLLRQWRASHLVGQAIPLLTLLCRSPEGFQSCHPELMALPGLRCVAGDM